MLKGFRDFIMRGNVVDLAVAVVVGAAFTGVVKSFTDWIITPLIAAVFGEPNLDNVMTFTINGANFSIGAVLTQLINFLIVAATIYFVIVLPMNKVQARFAEPAEAAGPTEIDLLTDIRDSLRSR